MRAVLLVLGLGAASCDALSRDFETATPDDGGEPRVESDAAPVSTGEDPDDSSADDDDDDSAPSDDDSTDDDAADDSSADDDDPPTDDDSAAPDDDSSDDDSSDDDSPTDDDAADDSTADDDVADDDVDGEPPDAGYDGGMSLADAGPLTPECASGNSRFCDGGAPGTCSQGTQTCAAGEWSECSAEPALVDTCVASNDDNCNGTPNDDCDCLNDQEQSCALGGYEGTCASGTQTCQDGQWGPCSVSAAAADTCAPGNDDNCNGTPNDGCTCEENETQDCSEGGLLGPCAAGTQTCGANGTWGACSIPPDTYDSCALDNDDNCNGVPNSPLDPACSCVEGDSRCVSGNPSTQRQVCTSAGTWGPATDCDNVCTGEGVCSGVCAPPERQCSSNIPQVCTSSGTWQSETACAASTPCQGGLCQACTSGTYAAGGTCVPWRTCAAGEYVSSAGTATTDRVCAPCAANTFSSTTNATSCTAWTTCDAGIGQIQDAAGTSSSDRTCKAFPSCSGLTNNCGSGGNESCCSSPQVPGGSFERWNNSDAEATISSFRLDKFEVTVGRFRKFKAAWDGGWRPAAAAGKHTFLNSGSGLSNLDSSSTYEPGWNKSWDVSVNVSNAALACDATFATWTNSAGSNERRPMNCLSWYDAHAFCIWDGGFLPSEAEWNYAAAGGSGTSGQRAYPWSSPSSSTTISASNASYWVDSTVTCGGDGVNGCTVADLIFVGTKTAGNGRYGHADMSGNVAEWTLDTLNSDQSVNCTNCTFIDPDSTSRMSRGGSYEMPAGYLYTLFGFGIDPTTATDGDGVRCARAP